MSFIRVFVFPSLKSNQEPGTSFVMLLFISISPAPFCKNPHLRMFIDFREGGREGGGCTEWGERENHWCERNTGCLLYTPWPGIEPVTFWFTGWCSCPLSLWARAPLPFYFSLTSSYNDMFEESMAQDIFISSVQPVFTVATKTESW